MSRISRIRRAAGGSIAAAAAVLALTVPAAAVTAPAAELVLIDSVHVGSPVLSTADSCRGWIHHGNPVLPVTVGATFITPNGDGPTGPYSTGTWTGGYGSSDDHFGTGQGHNHFQTFHMLLPASNISGYHGPGKYIVSVLVQDVGLAGGIATKDVEVTLPPPSPSTAEVKCDMAKPVTAAGVIGSLAGAALNKYVSIVCPLCSQAQKVLKMARGYSDVLNHYMDGVVEKDPPDNDYQQIAQPDPPPVLRAPGGLTSEQSASFSQLEQAYASDIGLLRALYTTIDRVWGADDAPSQYWYRKQTAALVDFATRAADGLDALPPLWDNLRSAFASDLPAFSITEADGLAEQESYDDGLPPDVADIVGQLGEGPDAQAEMAESAVAVDPADLVAADGVAALFGQNSPDLAGALRTFSDWARTTAGTPPPVVTDVSPSVLPSAGGTYVVVHGINLSTVTGVDFGPSTPTSGQANIVGCTDDECDVYAPAGSGTVDVVAIGPGGPSEAVAADRVTYVEPDAPQVTHVFPASGPTTGNNSVTITGTNLANGMVYFGPTVPEFWSCSDTACTAPAPQSANAGTVDITVVTPAGTSRVTAADQYTYVAGPPPPPQPPSVTGVSPSRGTNLGGDQVTVTGEHFTGATDVVFGADGQDVRDFTVVDDSHIKVVSPPGAPGLADLIVYGPGGASAVSAADEFTYNPARRPTITSVSPASGPDIGGTTVTITGRDLTNGFVQFGTAYAGDAVCSPKSCSVTAPPHRDGTVNISVSTENGESATSSADQYTYLPGPQPTITEVTPDTGPTTGGTVVVIFGTNLAGGTVKIGGRTASFVNYPPQCSMNSCVVTTPSGAAGAASVVVTTAAGSTPTGPDAVFSYAHLPTPVITSIDPASGWLAGDTDVHIYGRDLTAGRVYFGSQQAWSATCTQSSCAAQSPGVTSPHTVNVRVETAGGSTTASPASAFTYIEPTITSVSPDHGWTDGGETVTITGTNLADGTVEFGTVGIGDGTCTDTQCVVTAPRSSTSGTVHIRVQSPFITRSPETTADRYTYQTRPLPRISSVRPKSGTHDGGDKVTITGANLAGGVVRFGTYGARETCAEDTTCTVTSPSHPDGTVDITVTTSRGASAVRTADQYTFAAPGVPTVTRVRPASGPATGGTVVTVTGTNLVNSRITFGPGTASNVSCTRTTCTATTPSGAVGPVDVRVSTGGGISAITDADRFTYRTPHVPVITGVTPADGPASGGATVVVTGSYLTAASFAFGSAPATFVRCSDTSCTMQQPPHRPGTVAVRATVLGRTSTVTTAADFHYDRVSIGEHAIPGVSGATGGGQIVRGIGGAMWFTMPNLDKIGRIAADGTVTTYSTLSSGSMPVGITPGPDGRMWFTEEKLDKIAAIDADGNQTEYPVPGQPSDLRFVVAGPDGRMWFTLGVSGTIGAMTLTGTVTLYHLPDPTVFPYNILPGADGRLWFTEVAGNAIGTITTSGKVQEYPLPDADAEAWGLSTGGDGRFWFAEEANRAIGAIDLTGHVQMYKAPPSDTNPEGITYGPDGRMWFAAPDLDQVSALDPATGEVTDYPLPNGAGSEQPRYLAMDGRGNLWVTEFGGPNVAEVSGLTTSGPPSVTALSPASGAAGMLVTITGTNLSGATAVSFGTASATFHVVDPGHIAATAPSGPSGSVTVTVTTAHGTSAGGPTFGYGAAPRPAPVVTRISPDTGPVAGGTAVTITGTDLRGGHVSFGGTPATAVSCTATTCTATAPAGSQGPVHVRVRTTGGTSVRTDADRFTYLAPAPPRPVVTGLSPSSGPVAGGTTVTITGTELADGQVYFGFDAATATCTDTTCTATAPPGGAGVVDVRVVTAGGRSAVTSADRFTYVSG